MKRKPCMLKTALDSGVVIRKRLGLKPLGIGFLKTLDKWNVKPIRPVPPSKEFRLELVQEFKEEIVKLETLTNRDLSHWLVDTQMSDPLLNSRPTP